MNNVKTSIQCLLHCKQENEKKSMYLVQLMTNPATLWASAIVQLRSPLFLDVTLVTSYNKSH